MYEDSPSRYAVDVKRRQRWIRGDWQLLPWLLPWTPLPGGSRERNPLSILSRSKLLDNLRRSLVPAAILGMLLLGWLLSPEPGVWTLWVLSILLIPAFVISLHDVSSRPAEMPLSAHLRHVLVAMRTHAFADSVDACVSAVRGDVQSGRDRADPVADAGFKAPPAAMESIQRGRKNPRRQLARLAQADVDRSVCRRSPAPPALIHLDGHAALVASPVLLLWLLSPALMWWLGRPVSRKPVALSAQQYRFLGRLSRRTWSFFETWMTADDHWLPPDNVQEHPNLQVARRTSPTNIGLSLLANLAAYDFGYLQLSGIDGAHARTLCERWSHCRAIAGISTTGTTRKRLRSSRRRMSRPSTAAILQAIC